MKSSVHSSSQFFPSSSSSCSIYQSFPHTNTMETKEGKEAPSSVKESIIASMPVSTSTTIPNMRFVRLNPRFDRRETLELLKVRCRGMPDLCHRFSPLNSTFSQTSGQLTPTIDIRFRSHGCCRRDIIWSSSRYPVISASTRLLLSNWVASMEWMSHQEPPSQLYSSMCLTKTKMVIEVGTMTKPNTRMSRCVCWICVVRLGKN